MLNLKKVAVTGGLSCGKSSVCLILKKLGAYVVSADSIIQQLLYSDINLIQQMVNLLGSNIVVNGQLDRSQVAHIIFQDSQKLQAVEALLHPEVEREIDREYQQQQCSSFSPLFVAEIPLLFESGWKKNYDYTIAVVTKYAQQRYEKKTNDYVQFNKRMAKQFSLVDKLIFADYVLVNDQGLADLQKSTREIYFRLCKTTSPS
jgi:dephospho-CoA kinase